MFTSLLSVAVLPMVIALSIPGPQSLEKRETFTGEMTWYDKEGGLGINPGACGEINYPYQFIVAMNPTQYGTWANPNTAPVCHSKIWIQYQGSEPVQATVTDRCGGCKFGDIDGTKAVFNALVGNTGPGRVAVTWWFS